MLQCHLFTPWYAYIYSIIVIFKILVGITSSDSRKRDTPMKGFVELCFYLLFRSQVQLFTLVTTRYFISYVSIYRHII